MASFAHRGRGISALTLDLTTGRIKTIIWATGYHPDYSAIVSAAPSIRTDI